MYEILFDPHKGGYRVPENVYHNVRDLVLLNRECKHCYTTITPTNPHVLLNVCLNCFLDREGKGYTFIGIETPRATSAYDTFNFLSSDGYIFQTFSTGDAKHFGDVQYRCIPETLEWWGFPKIQEYMTTSDGQESYGYNIVIIGNFQASQVVVVRYYHRVYRDEPDHYFLIYKSGEIKPFDKRRGETFRLWKVAKANVEATKDEQGYYHQYGSDWKMRQIQDSWIYEEVVRIANAQVEGKEEGK